MAYFNDLTALLEKLSVPKLLFKLWKADQFGRMNGLQSLERLHPSLAIPNRRLYYLILRLLQAQRRIKDLKPFYPSEFHPLLQRITDTDVEDYFSDSSLDQLLPSHSFSHLISCVDITRWEKPLREIGAQRISLAHFTSCLPSP